MRRNPVSEAAQGAGRRKLGRNQVRRRVQRLTLDGNGEELWERRCREVREEMDEALEVCREADC